MDVYTACELAYKNGFEAGKQSNRHQRAEVLSKVEAAYEQVEKCHNSLHSRQDSCVCEELATLVQDILLKLLDIQVKLGNC